MDELSSDSQAASQSVLAGLSVSPTSDVLVCSAEGPSRSDPPSAPVESSEVPSSGPSEHMSVELFLLSPELGGSPVVASAFSEDSLAVVSDPLPLELVGSSAVSSDSSKDSLANVSSVPPDPGVREQSSGLVPDVVMASDSSEDSLTNVSERPPPEFAVPQPPPPEDRQVLYQPNFLGGFSVVDCQAKVWALRVQWVRRFVISPASWSSFFGSLVFCCFCCPSSHGLFVSFLLCCRFSPPVLS